MKEAFSLDLSPGEKAESQLHLMIVRRHDQRQAVGHQPGQRECHLLSVAGGLGATRLGPPPEQYNRLIKVYEEDVVAVLKDLGLSEYTDSWVLDLAEDLA